MPYILKLLWPHRSYPKHSYLPNLNDLNISIRTWGIEFTNDRSSVAYSNRLINAYVEERRAASRALRRLTAPIFFLRDNFDLMRGQVEELEIADCLGYGKTPACSL